MDSPATDIAHRLAERAEAVCRHYLSKGHREGRYWLIGDARNTPGRSLYVRLAGSEQGRGAAGKWTDAATGEHGDLLDIVAVAGGHIRLRDTLDEARRFLSLPIPDPGAGDMRHAREPRAPTGSPEASRRLFSGCGPLAGSVASAYLRGRALTDLRGYDALRFHPRCYYRPGTDDVPGTRTAWPALVAAVTDLGGILTGVHRTWLEPRSATKAPVATPRRAMGHLLGNGVRFGAAGEVMAAGEGLETMMSLRAVLPSMPMIAGTSSAHLAALLFPPGLRRLYVGRDDDPAGNAAVATLIQRAEKTGVEIVPLWSILGDFNDDLRQLGLGPMAAAVRAQLLGADVSRYLAVS